MTTQSPDTDADAELLQIRILRALPVWERIMQVDALNAMAESFARAGLRRAHPAASEAGLGAMVRGQRLRSMGLAPGPACAGPDRGGTP